MPGGCFSLTSVSDSIPSFCLLPLIIHHPQPASQPAFRSLFHAALSGKLGSVGNGAGFLCPALGQNPAELSLFPRVPPS